MLTQPIYQLFQKPTWYKVIRPNLLSRGLPNLPNLDRQDCMQLLTCDTSASAMNDEYSSSFHLPILSILFQKMVILASNPPRIVEHKSSCSF